jgi:hypothetical protein
MTSPPSPPNRRRRRILVAIAVLVLVSMVSWWNWSRGDVRFVGTWSVAETVVEGRSYFFFYSNGTGYVRDHTGSLSFPISWRVDGDRFSYGTSGAGLLNGLIPWIQGLSGRRILRQENWTIDTVDADHILLRHLPVGLEIRLRRE